MAKTNIGYTDEVSNPLMARPVGDESVKIGTFCEKPDPEGTCKNCWAEVLNERWGNKLSFDRANRDKIEWVKREKEMNRLLMRNKQKAQSTRNPGAPLMVFCNDTYDIFQPSISDELRDWVFDNYDMCTNLTLQIQTTYPSLMAKYFTNRYGENDLPAHYWIGMSAGNQPWLEANVKHLLKVRAQTRYIIFEPLVGPVSMLDVEGLHGQWGHGGMHHGSGTPDCPRKRHHHHDERCVFPIHWIIVGGESGNNPRPMNPEWARKLRDDCRRVGASFFFKQWGEWFPACEKSPEGVGNWSIGEDKALTHIHLWKEDDGELSFKIGKKNAGRYLDGKIWNEFPGCPGK